MLPYIWMNAFYVEAMGFLGGLAQYTPTALTQSDFQLGVTNRFVYGNDSNSQENISEQEPINHRMTKENGDGHPGENGHHESVDLKPTAEDSAETWSKQSSDLLF